MSDLSPNIFLLCLYHSGRLEWLTSKYEEPTQATKATKLPMLKLIAGAASYSCLSPGGSFNLKNGHMLQWYAPSAVQSVLLIALYRVVHSALLYSGILFYTLLNSVTLCYIPVYSVIL